MKILINDNELDALKDNDVLLSKAVNKMQSLEERNGSFSSEVACGLSMNNRAIFKDAQSSNSVTQLPYSPNTCKISVGSVEVLDGFAELEETNKEYILRAYSDISSLIDAIGESMLNELNLDYANGSSIDHLYNWTNVTTNRNNAWTKGYIYPNIDYGKWTLTTANAHWNDLYPSIFCKYLFLRIFHSIGYAVTGEFLSNDLFSREILPMVKIPTTPQYYLDELYTYGLYTQGRFFTNGYTINTYRIVLDAIPQNSSLQFGTFSRQEPFYGNAWFDYTAFYPTRYSPFTVKITLNVTKSGAGPLRLKFVEYTNSSYVGETSFVVTSGASVFTFDAIKRASDTFFIMFFEYDNGVTGSLNFFKWENTYKSTTLVDGDLLRMADCLPEVSQKDFLTTIINQYNLMLKVDTTKRTVDFSYFNSVEANKNSALDWSDLFDFSKEPEIKYKLEEYAQNSILKYETDENDNLLRLSPTYGQGVLFSNNINLENTKEVFMSKFAPIVRRICLKAPHTAEQAYIQLWITEENTLRTQNVKPRIAYVEYGKTLEINGTAPSEIGGGNGAKNTSPSAGVYFQQLEFSRLIPLYYKIVSNMLIDTYTLKANFNLKLKDFEEVDFTKPIFLDINLLGYGAISGYFYCNSINEFSLTNRSTTEVELIRI
jgi:hypothetical protein